MNGCAPGLALKERLQETRKWSIPCPFLTKYVKFIPIFLNNLKLLSGTEFSKVRLSSLEAVEGWGGEWSLP